MFCGAGSRHTRLCARRSGGTGSALEVFHAEARARSTTKRTLCALPIARHVRAKPEAATAGARVPTVRSGCSSWYSGDSCLAGSSPARVHRARPPTPRSRRRLLEFRTRPPPHTGDHIGQSPCSLWRRKRGGVREGEVIVDMRAEKERRPRAHLVPQGGEKRRASTRCASYTQRLRGHQVTNNKIREVRV